MALQNKERQFDRQGGSMKILVTGGSGFVGKAVCRDLEKHDHKVINFDLPDHDILKPSDIDLAMRNADMVLHVAAIANLYDTVRDPDTTFNVNVIGTYNVTQACKLQGKPLVYISTCCAYGPHGAPEVLATEESKPNAVELYARTKLMGEYLVKEVPRHTILRIGTVLGPGMRPALFNYKVLDKIRKGEQVQIYGDGKASRNYIYIDDLADGIIKAVDYTAETGSAGIVNLCGTEIIDLMQVVDVACVVTGKQPEVIHTAPRDMGDYGENISNHKAAALFDWIPETSYRTAMGLTWAWMKEGN